MTIKQKYETGNVLAYHRGSIKGLFFPIQNIFQRKFVFIGFRFISLRIFSLENLKIPFVTAKLQKFLAMLLVYEVYCQAL